MKLDKYELKSGEQLEVFEFVSIGQKGKIPKIVQFTPLTTKTCIIWALETKTSRPEKLMIM